MNKSYQLDGNASDSVNLSKLSAIFDRDETAGQASHLLANLGYALKKFKYLIIFCIIFFTFLGWYVTAKKPILYRSQLTMINEPDLNAATAGSDGSRFLVYLTQHYYQTQYEILTSKKLAGKVAAELIDKDIQVPTEAVTHLKRSPLYEWSRKINAWIGSALNAVSTFFRGAEILPENKLEKPANATNKEAQLLNRYTNLVKSGLSVSGGQRSQLITLSYVSTDREFAAEILNLVAGVYQDYVLESKQQINQTTMSWLVDQLETSKDILLESEKRLIDFRKQVQLTDTDSFETQNNANLSALNTQYNEVKLNYDELLARYGSKHPQVRKTYIELNALKRRVDNAAGVNVNSQDLIFESEKLEKEVETNRDLYLSYLTRFKGFNITGDRSINTVKVLDSAEAPAAPFSPNIRQGVLLWGMFGAAFGIVLSLLLSFLDRTYKTVEDIEHKLKLPVLGQVPFLSSKNLTSLISGKKHKSEPEMFYSANPKSIFSESINHIRTNLLFSKIDSQPQTILITSSIQAEGKTTVASNLAYSLAKIDNTILIDADLRKPRIASVFKTKSNADGNVGLVDCLAGLATFDDAVYQHPSFEKLTVLSSGTIPPNPQELLASLKFKEFLQELKSKYKFIVIDTAPVLPVSDSLVLGKIVDVLLVAVKAGSTTIKMTRETIKRLNIARVYPTGLVLTQLDRPNKAYGKHGLNYYYSYYGNDVKKRT